MRPPPHITSSRILTGPGWGSSQNVHDTCHPPLLVSFTIPRGSRSTGRVLRGWFKVSKWVKGQDLFYLILHLNELEKEMAIRSSTIAWKILWTEEPGRLQSMGSQRVRHDWATSLHFTSLHTWMKPYLPWFNAYKIMEPRKQTLWPLKTLLTPMVWPLPCTQILDICVCSISYSIPGRNGQCKTDNSANGSSHVLLGTEIIIKSSW